MKKDIRGRSANPYTVQGHRHKRQTQSRETEHTSKPGKSMERKIGHAIAQPTVLAASHHPDDVLHAASLGPLEKLGARPDGNAKAFQNFLQAGQLLQEINKPDGNAQEQQKRRGSTDRHQGRPVHEVHNSILSDGSSSSHPSSPDSQSSRGSVIADLPPNNQKTMRSAHPPAGNDRRQSNAADEYDSLADYWKAQAERRRSRIQSIVNEDMTRFRRTSTAQSNTPRDGPGLSPRQQKLLSNAEGMRKNSVQFESKYANMTRPDAGGKLLLINRFNVAIAANRYILDNIWMR